MPYSCDQDLGSVPGCQKCSYVNLVKLLGCCSARDFKKSFHSSIQTPFESTSSLHSVHSNRRFKHLMHTHHQYYEGMSIFSHDVHHLNDSRLKHVPLHNVQVKLNLD